MSALTGEVLAADAAGTWRVVLTAGGVPVVDRRRGFSADYVIYDEAHRWANGRGLDPLMAATMAHWGRAT